MGSRPAPSALLSPALRDGVGCDVGGQKSDIGPMPLLSFRSGPTLGKHCNFCPFACFIDHRPSSHLRHYQGFRASSAVNGRDARHKIDGCAHRYRFCRSVTKHLGETLGFLPLYVRQLYRALAMTGPFYVPECREHRLRCSSAATPEVAEPDGERDWRQTHE